MSQQNAHPGLSPALTVLIAIATGLAVASNYYAQPLLETIATGFNLSVNQAGFIVTAAQLGYATGLLLLVPLGDMFERRGLIVFMTLLAAGGMLITATSATLPMMILGTALTGLFSVVAQILVPLAATLAHPEKRGKTVGIIMSGLLLGILLARTVAGALASFGGWRTIYWVASVLMILMALILWRALPRYKQHSGLNYPQLLASIFSLFCRTPLLRTRAILGALSFANFSVLWTSMAFLLAAPPFNYSEGDRAVRPGGRRRGAGRFTCRASGRQGQSRIDHHRRPGAAAAVLDTYRVRQTIAVGADRRHPDPRSGGAGGTRHQPERDVPHHAGRAQPPDRRLHDQLLYRRRPRLTALRLGLSSMPAGTAWPPPAGCYACSTC